MKFIKYHFVILAFIFISILLFFKQVSYAAFVLSKDIHKKSGIPEQQKTSKAVQQQHKKNKQPHSKAEADQSSIWSNAFTFQKVWGTRTDPRTGIFSAWLQAGSLISNMSRGPDITLNINYNSNAFANPDGLGTGWSWNLTHFNPLNNQLTTSQGQSFQLYKIDKDHWWPRYYKVKDIQIDGNKKENFVITYANALKETLNHDGYETRLEQQDGRGVNFDYLPGTHLLNRITDDSGHKISLTYSDNYINVTSYSIDGSPVTVRINRINRQLRTVSFPVTSITDYKTVNINYQGSLLSKIIYPTGLVKTIDYNCNNAMKLPTINEQSRAICVVTKTNIHPGFGQPDIAISYTYDATNANGHNYLAHNSGLSFVQNSASDILFDAPSHYTYQTTTDNGIIKELYTFNKYHLLINTKTISDNDNRVLTESQNFFCRTDVSDGCEQTSFNQLPLAYDRPLKTVTRTWGDNPGELPLITTVIRRYDNRGRLLMSKDSYGREQKITYCSSDNNTSLPGCLKEPKDWSVVSLLHSTTASVPGSDLPAISKYIHYRKLPNINGKGYLLTISSEETYAGAHHISITRQYYDNPANTFTYGLLKKTSFYQNLTADSNSKPVVKYYHYSVNANHSVKTSYSETVVDVDKDKRLQSMSVSLSLFTNQVLSETDAEGKNTNHYFYDYLARITRINVAAGTVFATSKHYDYTTSPTLNQVLITAGNGLKRKIIFDGAGRKLKNFDETISDSGKADNKWIMTWRKIYDNHGRIAAEYSYIPYNINENKKQNAVYKTISLAAKPEYDNRGRIITLHLPDGKKIIRQYDDGKRCIINYEQDINGHYSSVSVVRNNALGKPIKQILLPAMQNPLVTKLCNMQAEKIPGAQVTVTTWDRYGRPVSMTDPTGRATTTRYDALGRVMDVINSAGDRTHNVYNINNQVVEKWAYPADSNKSYLLFSSAYDAADRLLWRAGEDGKKTHFTYTADGQIATKTTPTGHILAWQYNVSGLPVHEWLDGKTISQTNYDHTVVLPIKESDITGTTIFTYNDDGRLQQISHSGKNGYPNYHLQWHYNLARQVISAPDTAGNTIITKYDRLGRTTQAVYKMKNGTEEMLYRLIYDGFSRVEKIYYGSRTKGSKNSIRTIKYDKLGRQSDIADFTEPDNNQNKQRLFEEKYTYDADDNITQIIENGRADQRATLQYQYDQRNNLVAMSCTGSAELPLCPRDTAFAGVDTKEAPVILSQHYTFNDLNRIEKVTEQLSDIQQNRSLNKVMTYTYGDTKTPLRLQRVSTAWNHQVPVTKYLSYDDSGNMVIDGEGNHMTYNIFNQITSVLMPDGRQEKYTYDGSGRKVSEKSPTGNINYLLYVKKALIGEQNGHPGTTHMISYLGVAKAVDGVLDEFYGRNYKGDVITVMHKVASKKNSSHQPFYALKQYNIYSPYGMKWHKKSTQSLPLYQQTLAGFNGTRTDPMTKWQFLGAGHRTYSSAQRYFLSEDPAGDGYAFGGNNPIMNNDPDGNTPKWVGKFLNIINKITSFGLPDSDKGRFWKTFIWMCGWFLSSGVTIGIMFYTGTISIPLFLTELGAGFTNSFLMIATSAKPNNKGLNITAAISGILTAVVCVGINAMALSGVPEARSLAALFKEGEAAVGEQELQVVSATVNIVVPEEMILNRDAAFGRPILKLASEEAVTVLWNSLKKAPKLTKAMTKDNDIQNVLAGIEHTFTQHIDMELFKLLIGLKLRVLADDADGELRGVYNRFYNAIVTQLFGSKKIISRGRTLTDITFSPLSRTVFVCDIGISINSNKKIR